MDIEDLVKEYLKWEKLNGEGSDRNTNGIAFLFTRIIELESKISRLEQKQGLGDAQDYFNNL